MDSEAIVDFDRVRRRRSASQIPTVRFRPLRLSNVGSTRKSEASSRYLIADEPREGGAPEGRLATPNHQPRRRFLQWVEVSARDRLTLNAAGSPILILSGAERTVRHNLVP